MASPINFPLVTRVFPQTVGHQIVSVQPMAMPSGYLPFFLNPIQDIEAAEIPTPGYPTLDKAPYIPYQGWEFPSPQGYQYY